MKNLIVALIATLTTLANASAGEDPASRYVNLEPVVVNLSNDSYVSFTPALKLFTPEDAALIKSYIPVVRFVMIKSLMGQDARLVSNAAFIASFSESAVGEINSALGKRYIKGVFFTNWTVQ